MRMPPTSLLNLPISASISVISTGVALGLLVAYLQCRAARRQCPSHPGLSLIERIITLVWTVAGGVLTTITGHWLVHSGLAKRVVDWITSLIRFLL